MLRNLLSFALAACLTALYCQAQGAIDTIDSTTAVRIAESAASELYGQHEVDAEQPLSVMGNRGMRTWEVYGTPCCPDRNARHTCEADKCVGGIIHVSIRPTDGKVLLLERVILPRIAFTWLHGRTPQDVTYKWASDGGCAGTGGDPFILGGLCAGGLIRHAKVAIYAPGCESMKFDLDLPSSETTKTIECSPLPNKTLRGFIPPDRIPRVPLDGGLVLRELQVSAYLETGWRNDFLDGPREHNEESIALGIVGVIDPAKHGDFEITIPDFSRDPSYSSYSGSGRNHGLIKLRLMGEGCNLGTIVPLEGLEPGLTIESEYPDTVVFKGGG